MSNQNYDALAKALLAPHGIANAGAPGRVGPRLLPGSKDAPPAYTPPSAGNASWPPPFDPMANEPDISSKENRFGPVANYGWGGLQSIGDGMRRFRMGGGFEK